MTINEIRVSTVMLAAIRSVKSRLEVALLLAGHRGKYQSHLSVLSPLNQLASDEFRRIRSPMSTRPPPFYRRCAENRCESCAPSVFARPLNLHNASFFSSIFSEHTSSCPLIWADRSSKSWNVNCPFIKVRLPRSLLFFLQSRSDSSPFGSKRFA